MNKHSNDQRWWAFKTNRPQFGLSTVLLLIATLAIWISFWTVRSANSRIASELPSLWKMEGTLRIEDETQYALVKKPPKLHNEKVWDVYLPQTVNQSQGQEAGYELVLSSEISSTKELRYDMWKDRHVSTVELHAGQHQISLLTRKDGSEVDAFEVLLNGESVFSLDSPVRRDEMTGPSPKYMSSSRGVPSTSVQQRVDEPLEIFQIRYRLNLIKPMVYKPPTATDEPLPGIQLWIRQKDASDDIE